MPRFSLFQGSEIERSFELDCDLIRIGRMAGLEIELPTPTVSREHARIVREGGQFVLEDAGSVNGVYVRDERVTRHTLSAGDTIRIEKYTLVYEPPEDVYRAGRGSGEDEDEPRPGDPNITYLNIARFLPKDL